MQKRILKNSTNDARMSMKTKDRSGKAIDNAGMSMKTKDLAAKSGNVVESKGGY
jgi:hypothetical protein